MKIMGVLVLAAVGALAACSSDNSQDAPSAVAPQVAAPAPVKHGPTPAELTAGMVEAAGQGKSQAPVQLKFELPQRPTVGKVTEVTIALMPQIAAGPAALQMTGSDGLDVMSGYEHIDIPSVDPTEVYRHIVKVTPAKEGVFFLTVETSLKHDEISESRTFSIPIIVAPK